MDSVRLINYETIQNILTEHYYKHRKLNIQQMYQLLQPEHCHLSPYNSDYKRMWGALSDEDFELRLKKISYNLHDPLVLSKSIKRISEEAIFAMNYSSGNVLVYHHYNYLKEFFHSHSYFEIYYVFYGSCNIHFEETLVSLTSGDFLIIAPNAVHFVSSDADNFVLCINIRASNFDELFFHQMSRHDILAVFFRNIVYNKAIYSYLLFETQENQDIKMLIKNITMESLQTDSYNTTTSASWLDILFSTLLRNFYTNMQTYPPISVNNFSRIIQYISGNYRTVTLNELCDIFSYSKPYLCNIIKENTGQTFTTLVNMQKIDQATAMLLNTDCSIDEIAEYVGFTSSDYFSKLFKKSVGQTPTSYRIAKRSV